RARARPDPRRRRAHWCRRRTWIEALPPFHGVVERLAIIDVHQMTTTAKAWEWWQIQRLLSARREEEPQGGLHQFRHGAALARCLAPQLCHDGIIDVEGGLHMDNHTADMVVRQAYAE